MFLAKIRKLSHLKFIIFTAVKNCSIRITWAYLRNVTSALNMILGTCVLTSIDNLLGPPGVLGILGEGLFIFRELGSTAYYFRGAGEQAHTFWDLGSTTKK